MKPQKNILEQEQDVSLANMNYMQEVIKPVKDWENWVEDIGKAMPSISSEMVYVQEIKTMIKANFVFFIIGVLMILVIILSVI